MIGEQIAPAAVAQFHRALRRADDIGEHHGRQNPIRFDIMPRASQKFFDLIQQRVLIPDEG